MRLSFGITTGLFLIVAGCEGEKLHCEDGEHEEDGACVLDDGSDTGGGTDTGDTVTVPPAYTSLDAFLEPLREEWGLPSLAAAVVVGGEVTELGAVGLRSADSDVSVTHADKYHLGSNTKAMTASLTALLVEDGTLSWETTMADAFPELTIHEDFQAVTLEMMLAHVGGLSTGIPNNIWTTLYEPGVAVEQRAWFAEQMLATTPNTAPGTTYEYSNSGYMIVGAAIEAITGSSWESLMSSRIFEPLGMDSCGFGAPDPDGSLSQPWGHISRDSAPMDGSSASADNPPALGPAGTVHCGLEDWGRFVSAHLRGARGESDWLSPETFSRLHTPLLGNYSLGWLVLERSWAGSLPVLHHTGSNTMFYSNLWIAPSLNQAWLVTTNQGDSGSATDAVVSALFLR